MTNTIALSLGILIIAGLMLDQFVLHWDVPQFVMRHLIDLTQYIAFWR
ncbi:hypothetical protein [Yoonia sp. SS1-5]|uniref:Uncharacterized protein n=1 Tax=Yoonia rhodophyticola TaxID=3137370 RepID=A0AAN0MJI7_9RHOB